MMKEHIKELNNSELEQIIGGIFVIKPTVVPKIIDGPIDIEPQIPARMFLGATRNLVVRF